MPINIKNREAEELLAELKRRTGKGTTDLLLSLLREEKLRSDGEVAQDVKAGMDNARRLQQAWNSLPVIDDRPFDEILAYDADGFPR
ncbi:type II toxin-antitoxin system VapB family antitoxin [Enterovirga rhinocerotis]|uniref:Antitoxin VapB n=1 Tax=Enterovirga rhinocerotis TaxID=1339210 RepID=A0A4R7C576_9HYPH|nr:type II toxin-antitoxin system VapB family antitoxin [Enterovirga rhinocerotis]TDR93203.1 hypothetical protein EV668_0459 [Enterovirga rhinocerotis]